MHITRGVHMINDDREWLDYDWDAVLGPYEPEPDEQEEILC